MGKLPKQTKRIKLIRCLRELGFDGPHTGVGDHPEFMRRELRTVKLPNMHHSDIGEGLLKKILSEAGVSVDEWLGISSSEGDDPRGAVRPTAVQ